MGELDRGHPARRDKWAKAAADQRKSPDFESHSRRNLFPKEQSFRKQELEFHAPHHVNGDEASHYPTITSHTVAPWGAILEHMVPAICGNHCADNRPERCA